VTDPDEPSPQVGEAPSASAHVFDGSPQSGRRSALGEPRHVSEETDDHDLDEEDYGTRSPSSEKMESDVDRHGFRFNVIARKDEFVRTTEEPELGPHALQITKLMAEQTRSVKPQPKSTTCHLL
jgi:hypothetical protein